MGNQSVIIKSKLRIPRTSSTIERSQLLAEFSEIEQKKAVVIKGGAGYGKTTLAAQYIRSNTLNSVWYSLDEKDHDLSTFVTYLITGIQEYYPEFGRELIHEVGVLSASERSREEFLPVLLKELESGISTDLYFVLDDFHLMQESEGVTEAVSFLLNHLPSHLHFIIIGRTEPNIRLSRLRSMNEVVDIGERQLGFDFKEVGIFYDNILAPGLTDAQLKIVLQRTGGWAAGLVLFYHLIKGVAVGQIDDTLSGLAGKHKSYQKYFEENLFTKLDPETRAFMLKTSILSNMKAEFCDAYLQKKNSAAILQYLEEGHFFTSRSQEKNSPYTYHQLLKEFLVKELFQSTNSETVKDLHRTASRLYWQEEYPEEALAHALKGADFAMACEYFLKSYFQLFLLGRLSIIRQFYEKVPDEMTNKEPELILQKARWLSFSGKPVEAVAVLQSGTEHFDQSTPDEIREWFRKELGMQYYYMGNHSGALSQMEDLLQGNKEDHQLSAEVAGMMAFLYSVKGESAKADKMLNLSRSHLEWIEGDMKQIAASWLKMYQSFKSHCFGQFRKSKLHAEEGLRTIEKMEMHGFLPLAYLQTAYAETSLGNHSIAIQLADKGINAANRMGLNDSFPAWLFTIKGQAKLGMRQWDEAVNSAQNSLELFREIGNDWGMATAYDLLARIYLIQDSAETTQYYLERGYEALKDQQFRYTRGFLDFTSASLLIKKNQLEEAVELIDRSIDAVESNGHLHLLFLLLKAGSLIRAGKETDAIQSYRKGMELAVKNEYYFDQTLELCSVQRELAVLEKSHSDSIEERPAEFPALRVEFFGPFKVVMGSKEIPVAEWKSSKSVQLFKFLATKADKGYISRDVIMEELWPGEPQGKCLKRLNVALTTLRNLLEPERQAGSTSQYIIRRNDTYRIELGRGGGTDLLDFERAITASEDLLADGTERQAEAIDLLLKAAAIRKDAFLESEPYLDWAIRERDRTDRLYQEVLAKIIDYLEEKDEVQQAIRFADKLLDLDPLNEAVYRKLMDYHAGVGNQAMVLRTFRNCQEQLTRDLGLSPSEETIRLYESLIKRQQL